MQQQSNLELTEQNKIAIASINFSGNADLSKKTADKNQVNGNTQVNAAVVSTAANHSPALNSGEPELADGNAGNDDESGTSPSRQNVFEFTYYNDAGLYIGESQGDSPQADLFEQANYVFSNANTAINNDETIANIELDIKKYKNQRLSISVSHIGRLMDINRKIESLEQLLEQKKSEQSAA